MGAGGRGRAREWEGGVSDYRSEVIGWDGGVEADYGVEGREG